MSMFNDEDKKALFAQLRILSRAHMAITSLLDNDLSEMGDSICMIDLREALTNVKSSHGYLLHLEQRLSGDL